MISLQTLVGLAIASSAFMPNVDSSSLVTFVVHNMMLRVRRNAGYLGGYDANTGAFVGAISRNLVTGVFTADGNPHAYRGAGPFPTQGFTQNTFGAGYGNLHTDCGENQVWVLGSAVGPQVLVPSWSKSAQYFIEVSFTNEWMF
ncbi:hypothetical protein C8J57DRAFT_1571799 [Mycena rebaudengoi]|nr:hypothetical protein C8J57DRAFT_1571799 [Mycena rebaudengoi]